MRHFKPKASASPKSIRTLRSIFGKLVIHWGPRTCRWEYDGVRRVTRYEVIASDADSVVIRYWDDFCMAEILRHIHFEGDYYWMPLSGSLTEHFRRIQPAAKRLRPKK
ncbi:hypothetical protein NA78x_000314 [Anatilimnocola sp. NA78]|uniref:hypothetical protein n=1 Tax=Anatilimnocola sp. NA78 TaxID=3415683 RepID=UPI003CE46DA8